MFFFISGAIKIAVGFSKIPVSLSYVAPLR